MERAEEIRRLLSDIPFDESADRRETAEPTRLGDSSLNLTTVEAVTESITARARSISYAIQSTVIASRQDIFSAVREVESWITNRTIVRVIGAGRALLAAAIPANRLAHAGAPVYVLHDVVPLPNSLRGGAILAASASGETPSVLNIMATARERNPHIRILGVARYSAESFADLCDVFVGVHDDSATNPYDNPLQALADTGEYVISELLDAIVVAAAKRLGRTDEDFREGHEDLGDTGPYLPESIKDD